MNVEVTDHVPGFSDEEVEAMVAEAEAGYDLQGVPSEPNPHHVGSSLVPDDLREAIEDRARRDGLSPEAVVREAIEAHLHIA